jgi:hypothetical protein
MELNHPGWQDSVENAASVAVDAAIRAMTYNGANALMLVCVCVCVCVCVSECECECVVCVWCGSGCVRICRSIFLSLHKRECVRSPCTFSKSST